MSSNLFRQATFLKSAPEIKHLPEDIGFEVAFLGRSNAGKSSAINALVEQKGLAKIEVEKGDKFDPDHHEAVTQIPAPSDDLKGKIVDIIEKGYKLGETVIRFPKVVIGQ